MLQIKNSVSHFLDIGFQTKLVLAEQDEFPKSSTSWWNLLFSFHTKNLDLSWSSRWTKCLSVNPWNMFESMMRFWRCSWSRLNYIYLRHNNEHIRNPFCFKIWRWLIINEIILCVVELWMNMFQESNNNEMMIYLFFCWTLELQWLHRNFVGHV